MVFATIQRYNELRYDESALKRLTGLKQEAFEALAVPFKEQWEAYLSKFTLEGVPRVRQMSVRKNSIFADPKDALLFGLIYLKGNINQEKLAISFGIDQPKTSKYLALIQRLILQVLEANPRILPRQKRAKIIDSINV
ncbi:MAG: hypothetical protein ACK4GN_06090 [Runella sp.]